MTGAVASLHMRRLLVTLAAGVIPRLGGRVRALVSVFSFVVLPLAGAVLGWLEGRLKLQ